MPLKQWADFITMNRKEIYRKEMSGFGGLTENKTV
jgi:hypothetical protein